MRTLHKKLQFLTDIFWQIKDKKDLEKLFADILSPQEIETLYERFQLIKLLREWYSQREIADKLWISTTTVNRGSRVLKYGTGILNKLDI